MSQVITIHTDGAISGLQVKPNKGLDLRTLGKADIQRASEVLFDTDAQQWFVEIRKGKYEGQVITYDFYSEKTGKATLYHTSEPRMLFDEYEDAVACEIETLDAIRLREGHKVL